MKWNSVFQHWKANDRKKENAIIVHVNRQVIGLPIAADESNQKFVSCIYSGCDKIISLLAPNQQMVETVSFS